MISARNDLNSLHGVLHSNNPTCTLCTMYIAAHSDSPGKVAGADNERKRRNKVVSHNSGTLNLRKYVRTVYFHYA